MNKRAMFCTVIIVVTGTVRANAQAEDFLLAAAETAFETFSVYADRADLEQERRHWLARARFGIDAVSAEWERQVSLLTEKGFDPGEELLSLTNKLDNRLEQRFQRWLFDSFFRGLKGPEPERLLSAVESANAGYLYQIEENAYLYDEAGDPLTLKTEGAEEDRTKWADETGAEAQRMMADWERNAHLAAVELLDYSGEVPAEELASYTCTYEEYRNSRRGELEMLLAAEESRFLSGRMHDSYSLRKKEENRRAEEITEGLLASMRNETEKGLEEIKRGLEKRIMDLPEEGLSIDAEEWRESFKYEFDRGMDMWHKAEELLLRERMEWERRVTGSFTEAETAWDRSYEALVRERDSWESELAVLLEKGREEWVRKESDLFAAIEAVRLETAGRIRENSAAMQLQIGNLVEMYTQSKETMRAAEVSGNYWMAKTASFAGHSAALFGSPEFEARLDALPESEREQEAVRELIFWSDVYTTYKGYAQTAERGLAETFAVTLRDDADAPAGPDMYRQQVFEETWQHCALDEYQLELLRLQSLKEYWREQTDIAEEVCRYAGDTSSNRMTEAETDNAYEAALGEFRGAEARYLQHIEELEFAGTKLSEGRDGLALLQEELQEMESSLRTVREEYSRALDLYITDNTSFFQKKIGGDFRRLLDYSGMNGAGEHNDITKVRGELRTAADFFGYEKAIEKSAAELTALIQGDTGVYGGKDIGRVEEEAERAAAWTFAENPEEFSASLTGCFGLEEDDEYYRQFRTFHDGYTEAVLRGDHNAAWYYRMLVRTIAKDFINRQEREYKVRVEAAEFLIAPSMETWAGAFLPADSLPDGGGADTLAGWYSALRRDAADAAVDYYRAAAETELEALRLLGNALEAAGAGRAAGLPGDVIDSFRAEAEKGKPAYELALSAVIGDGKDLHSPGLGPDSVAESIAASTAFLESLSDPGFEAAEGGEQRCFTGIFVTEEGLNTTALLLSDALHTRLLRESRYETAKQYSKTAGHLYGKNNTEAYGEIRLLFEEANCIDAEAEGDDDFTFNPPDVVVGELESAGMSSRDIGEWLRQFSEDLSRAAGEMPEYVRADLREYAESLVRYFLLETVRAGGEADVAAWPESWTDAYSEMLRKKKNYRSYLGGPFLTGEGPAVWEKDGGYLDTAAEGSGEYTNGLFYSPGDGQTGGDWYENMYLEVCNSSVNAGNAAAESLRAACRTDAGPVSFGNIDDVIQYFTGEDPLGPFRPGVLTEEKYRTAAASYERVRGEIEYLKTQIADRGASLELYYRDRNGMLTSVVKPLEERVGELEQAYRALQGEWARRAEQFEHSSGAYQNTYTELREAEEDLDKAAFELEKIEAVRDFAASGYLRYESGEKPPASEAPDNFEVDPRGRYEYAEIQYANVTAAFDAVADLYQDRAPGDFIEGDESARYREAFEEYREHYHNTLALRQLEGLLQEAKAEQERRVASARKRTADEMEKILADTGGMAGTGLTDRYMDDPALVGWFDRVGNLVQSEGDAFFSRWGRAYWHITFSGAEEDAVEEFLSSSFGEQWTFLRQEGIDMSGYARALAAEAYAGMGGTEREDFSDYLGLSGLAGDGTAEVNGTFPGLSAGFTDFLTEKMALDLNSAVAEKCAAVKENSVVREQELLIAAGASYALGVLFSWFPPVCVPAFASAASLGIAAAVMHDRAGRYGAVAEETARRAENIGSRVRLDTLPMREAFSGYREEKISMLEETEKLKKLTAEPPEGEQLEAGRFIDGILTAAEIMNADIGALLPGGGSGTDALRSGLTTLVTGAGYLDAVPGGQRGNTGDMMHALAAAADGARNDAAEAFSYSAAELEAARQAAAAAYRRELAEVLGKETEADIGMLAAAAEDAFNGPRFNAARHYSRTLALSAGLMDKIVYPSGAPLEKELIAEQGRDIYKMFNRRMENYFKAEEYGWQQRVFELRRRMESWEETVSALFRRGAAEWSAGIGKMESERGRWLSRYVSGYRERRDMWEMKYAALLAEKNRWVRGAAESAARQAGTAVLKKLTVDAETGVRAIEGVIIPDLPLRERDPAEIAEEVLRGGSFGSLLERTARYNRSIAGINTRLYSSPGGGSRLSGRMIPALHDYAREDRNTIESHIALITADQARRKIAEVLAGLRESVASANDRQDTMFDRMLFGENFSRQGDEYSREAMVDDTVVTGRQYEKQTVAAFNEYEFPRVVLGIDLSKETLSVLSPAGVEAQIDRAIGKIEAVWQQVFGSAPSEASPGEFGEHVGEAAECVEAEKIDETASDMSVNIKNGGSGETGRITSALIIYNLIQGRGWSEFNKPAYDKRLWDDDGDLLKAPTIRGLADIGTAVLVNAFAPGVGFLLNTVDDALFTLADAAGGRLSGGQAVLQLGKKLASSAVTAGISAGFDAIGNAVGNSVVGRAFLAGSESFAKGGAGGFINSVEIGPEGGLVFNNDRLSGGFEGKALAAGYASAAVSGAVTAALSGSFEGLEGTGIDGRIEAVSALGGSAAALGVEYGIAGTAAVNLLNTADIAAAAGILNRDSRGPDARGVTGSGGVGLLELSLGGENGAGLAFGMGGTNFSISRLAGAAGNIGVWIRQQQIRGYDLFGKADIADGYDGYAKAGTALRGLWAFGDSKGETLVESLLSGDDTLRVGYVSKGAVTRAPDSPGGGRIIDIAGLGSAADKNSRLRAGITLQHEAWRDGVISALDLQFYETLNSVAAHTEMAMKMASRYGPQIITGDRTLKKDAAAYFRGARALAGHTAMNYDFSADYWKLRQNGLLEYDGSGYLYNEQGEQLRDDNGKAVGAKGIEGGLLAILGLEDTAGNRQKVIDMMLKADMTYGVPAGMDAADPANWYWNLGTHDALNMGKHMEAPETMLHYLQASDHFGVLRSRGVIDLSYSSWTYGNAVETMRSEIGRMENELRERGFSRWKVNRCTAMYRDLFTTLDKGGDAFDMLTGLNSFSEELRGRDPVTDHIQVLFGDRLFRGSGGDMGLAEALRAEYNARENPNYRGYAIQDIAAAFTKMNIIYGGEDETASEPGSVFRGNYPGMFSSLGYGDRIDFRADSSYGFAPSLDCSGFTGLVYHAAGYLSNGENLNEGPYSFAGVKNIFSDTRITVTDVPQVGDLVGVDGHVGFLGEDGEGNRLLIHSAPDPGYTGWSDLGHKKSGPRLDTFSSGYMERLVEAGLFRSFAAEFGGNYGRWNVGGNDMFTFDDEDIEKFYMLFEN